MRERAGHLFSMLFGCLVAVGLAHGQWTPIGPAPIKDFFPGGVTGRASAIAVNPENGDQIWLGTAAGGVWFSSDAGRHWAPISDREESLAIGAIALADCDVDGCGTVYAGTGENAIRRDTYYGAGLLVGTPDPSQFQGWRWELRDGQPSGYDFRGGSINDVVVDQFTSGDTTRLYITLSSGVTMSATEATITAPEPVGGYGIYRSLDQGVHWTKLTVTDSGGARPTDLEMDPDQPNHLYAGFMGRGVFKSVSGGNSWCPLNPGLDGGLFCAVGVELPDPTMEAFDHVEIAATRNSFVPGSPTVLYATFGNCTDPLFDNCKPSMYKSLDAGATWVLTRPGDPTDADSLECGRSYSRYTHALAVHPADHNIVFLGGMILCYSGASGANLIVADGNTAPGTPVLDVGKRIHLDHHEIVFHPGDSRSMYSTSDGGFAFLQDLTQELSWTPRNDDLQITGFQTIATSPLVDTVLGASQDNGGQLWWGSPAWETAPCCGDGGYTAIDLDDASIMYAGGNFGRLKRSMDGGISWGQIDEHYTPPGRHAWYAPFVQDPTPFAQDPTQHLFYYGGNRLWMSEDDATTWTAVSPVFSDSMQPEIWRKRDVINAIVVAPSDAGRIYVGLHGGEIFTTGSACPECQTPGDPEAECEDPVCWTRVSDSLPGFPVTGIAVHPTDPQTAYVSFSGFGTHERVWRTGNAGESWEPIVAGLPAGVPVNTIVNGLGSTDSLLVGLDSNATRSTVYSSTSGGDGWVTFGLGLPNSPVISISVDPTRDRIFAATHGRGAFMVGPSSIFPGEVWREYIPIDIPFFGQAFTPDEDCTIRLLQPDGTPCVDSAVDAMGATLRTDGEGRLVSSMAGMFADRPMAWVCFDGQCAGGVDITSCDGFDSVEVGCGSDVAGHDLVGPQMVAAPPSALLRTAVPSSVGGLGAGTPGRFELTASVQAADGSTRSLCTVEVPIAIGDDTEDVLTAAVDAIDQSETCAAGTVDATLVGGDTTGGEDDFRPGPWLRLAAPGVTGSQLVPAIHAGPGDATGRCFELSGLGSRVRNQLQALSLNLETPETGAAGGEITVVEKSGLGTCGITVPTEPGQTADEIAIALEAAFQAPGIPGPDADCPSRRNPRDLVADGTSIRTVSPSALEVCFDDPAGGFSLRSDDLVNAHPAAACADRIVECTGPQGTIVTLDASASRDPDSTPGTSDDLVGFDWYEDFGSATEVLLGSGEQLDSQLALGSHAVTLVVTDGAGLQDRRSCSVDVVDTTPPTIVATVAPASLFPPNHRLVSVSADVQASDACGSTAITLTSVVSDEPDDAPGPADGDTTSDIRDAQPGTLDLDILLRAERDRMGAGRTYSVLYAASDGSGNVATSQPVAVVPLDDNGVVEPITILLSETADGTVVNWTLVPAASHYNVVSGELQNITESTDQIDLGPYVCIEAVSIDSDTMGNEDSRTPAPSAAYFYVVEYATPRSGYGTETADKPRVLPIGPVCE